jgi:hypothetical protein
MRVRFGMLSSRGSVPSNPALSRSGRHGSQMPRGTALVCSSRGFSSGELFLDAPLAIKNSDNIMSAVADNPRHYVSSAACRLSPPSAFVHRSSAFFAETPSHEFPRMQCCQFVGCCRGETELAGIKRGRTEIGRWPGSVRAGLHCSRHVWIRQRWTRPSRHFSVPPDR